MLHIDIRMGRVRYKRHMAPNALIRGKAYLVEAGDGWISYQNNHSEAIEQIKDDSRYENGWKTVHCSSRNGWIVRWDFDCFTLISGSRNLLTMDSRALSNEQTLRLWQTTLAVVPVQLPSDKCQLLYLSTKMSRRFASSSVSHEYAIVWNHVPIVEESHKLSRRLKWWCSSKWCCPLPLSKSATGEGLHDFVERYVHGRVLFHRAVCRSPLNGGLSVVEVRTVDFHLQARWTHRHMFSHSLTLHSSLFTRSTGLIHHAHQHIIIFRLLL